MFWASLAKWQSSISSKIIKIKWKQFDGRRNRIFLILGIGQRDDDNVSCIYSQPVRPDNFSNINLFICSSSLSSSSACDQWNRWLVFGLASDVWWWAPQSRRRNEKLKANAKPRQCIRVERYTLIDFPETLRRVLRHDTTRHDKSGKWFLLCVHRLFSLFFFCICLPSSGWLRSAMRSRRKRSANEAKHQIDSIKQFVDSGEKGSNASPRHVSTSNQPAIHSCSDFLLKFFDNFIHISETTYRRWSGKEARQRTNRRTRAWKDNLI